MALILKLLILFFALISPVFCEDLIIRNVNLIDTSGGPIQTNRTVVIRGDRIVSAEQTESELVGKGTVIDGTGKYLIPGLWDMHVHWYQEASLGLFIANGVTGVRQMFGNSMHLKWRDEADTNSMIPRHIVASPILDGPVPIWRDSWAIRNEKEGRNAVDKAKTQGYNFAKVYSGLPRDAFFAIAEESAKRGMPFAGHVPLSISVLEAINAGQKSIEHMNGVLEACTTIEMDIKEAQTKVLRETAGNQGIKKQTRESLTRIRQQTLENFDSERASQLIAVLAKSGTSYCPTLTVNRVMVFASDLDFAKDARLKYMPKFLRIWWKSRLKDRMENMTAKDFNAEKSFYQKQLSLIPMMQRAGVKFLAGTDVLNPYCYPGFSIHDELSLLVEAGLTPMEALQAATLNPAVYTGKEKELGTIEAGKFADLVLLDQNPLENIENTKKIAAVIFKGALYDRAALDKILADHSR
jgi:hypothetical protein